jgi:hypothetical protein
MDVPVRLAVVRETVRSVPAALSGYAAAREVNASFAALPASAVATFTMVNWVESVMVATADWLYERVEATTSVPPMVTARVVMFADRVGAVSV